MSRVLIPFEWNLEHREIRNANEDIIRFSIEDIDWQKIREVSIYFREITSNDITFKVVEPGLPLTFTRGSRHRDFTIRSNVPIPEDAHLFVEINIDILVEYHDGERKNYDDTKVIDIIRDKALFTIVSLGGQVTLKVTKIDKDNIFGTNRKWITKVENKGNIIDTFSDSMLQWEIYQDKTMTILITPPPIEIIDIQPNEVELVPSQAKEIELKGKFVHRPTYKQIFYVKVFTTDSNRYFNVYKIIFDPSSVEIKEKIAEENENLMEEEHNQQSENKEITERSGVEERSNNLRTQVLIRNRKIVEQEKKEED